MSKAEVKVIHSNHFNRNGEEEACCQYMLLPAIECKWDCV